MFIGPRAKNFNPRYICGYGMADGLPRNYICDEESRFKLNLQEFLTPGARFNGPLKEAFSHDLLFANYPEIAEIPYTLEVLPLETLRTDEIRTSASCNRDPGEADKSMCGSLSVSSTIRLNRPLISGTKTDKAGSFLEAHMRDLILHEIQHVTQHIEGFATGSSPSREHSHITGTIADRAAKKFHRSPDNSETGQRHLLRARTCDAIQTIGVPCSPDPLDEKLLGILCPTGVPLERMKSLADRFQRLANRAYWNTPGEIEARVTQGLIAGTPHLRNSPMTTGAVRPGREVPAHT